MHLLKVKYNNDWLVSTWCSVHGYMRWCLPKCENKKEKEKEKNPKPVEVISKWYVVIRTKLKQHMWNPSLD